MLLSISKYPPILFFFFFFFNEDQAFLLRKRNDFAGQTLDIDSLAPWVWSLEGKNSPFHLSVAPTEFIAAGRLSGLWKKIQRTRNLAALQRDERSPSMSWKGRTLSECPSPSAPVSTIMLSSIAHMGAFFPDQRWLCFRGWCNDVASTERHNSLVQPLSQDYNGLLSPTISLRWNHRFIKAAAGTQSKMKGMTYL